MGGKTITKLFRFCFDYKYFEALENTSISEQTVIMYKKINSYMADCIYQVSAYKQIATHTFVEHYHSLRMIYR